MWIANKARFTVLAIVAMALLETLVQARIEKALLGA